MTVVDSSFRTCEKVRATVKMRTELKGFPLKLQAFKLNGKTLNLTAGWVCDDDDCRYPGEQVFLLYPEDSELGGIGWIAQGDLINIHSIEKD